MIEEDVPRDLAALVVPLLGSLHRVADPWEPCRLCDAAGAVIGPVASYLGDLQAAGRPETALRAYATALLRWFRFLWAIGVAWDHATRVEARDFCRWIQIADKPQEPLPCPATPTRWRPSEPGDAALVQGAAAPQPAHATQLDTDGYHPPA